MITLTARGDERLAVLLEKDSMGEPCLDGRIILKRVID
jgi:hypothetical protein